jgi:hypothetical protein
VTLCLKSLFLKSDYQAVKKQSEFSRKEGFLQPTTTPFFEIKPVGHIMDRIFALILLNNYFINYYVNLFLSIINDCIALNPMTGVEILPEKIAL